MGAWLRRNANIDSTTAVFADVDIDAEHSFEALPEFHGWNERRFCMGQNPADGEIDQDDQFRRRVNNARI